ncbi:glycoside hydrolase family 45 protein [Collybiopsis luxurians FD-317 M1]|uniref:Glycoside hydrolase family 45 protein n=1 Tax=Collybiopsis luxurians FD-317 M1 TaxID=944289 RepID=A0A0D0CR61_9AGAR|nr:glycoside hydrolase family 45 protein [Collybiopsis luxurians FD-317 M1]
MKYLTLTLLSIAASLTAVGGYLQLPSGSTSFTMYGGCGQAACGVTGTGFTAAMNQLAFGAPPGLGPGDACGRCFSITGTEDPFSPSFTGPFNTIIVKVTDLCPVAGNEQWCGQTTSNPVNSMGTEFHFDICEDTGGANAFFPPGHGALLGTFTEVSCSEWSGADGASLFNGSCIKGESAAFWPGGIGCGNQGVSV